MSDTHTVSDHSNAFVQQLLLGEAVDGADALVFVADDEMRYLAVNDEACKTLGYTRAELLGLRVTDVVETEAAPALYGSMIRTGTNNGGVVLRRKDGVTLSFNYRARRVQVSGLTYYVSVGFVEG